MRVDCCSQAADERLNWCHGFVEVGHQWDKPIFKALKLIFFLVP